MAQRSLVFDITTQDGQTLAALDRVQSKLKQTGTAAETTTKRTKSAGEQLGGYLKTIAVAAAGREILTEANQSQTTAAQTAAVIKSTGNAAEVSAAQQDKYVQSLSKTAAIDDEVIAGGANLLRTFTNIKGAQFGEALGVSLDFAAAKGVDLASAIQVIGKDVNDPVRGLALLRRQGIQLSDSQQELVKSLVSAGQAAKAQEVIIGALQERFGGSAAAMATDSARVKVALQNAAESAGKDLLPAVKVVAGLAQGFAALPAPVQTSVLVLTAATVAANKLQERLGEGGLRGALSADVSELGTMNTVLGATVVGLGAYGVTLDRLNKSVQFHGDVQGLAKDLEDLGSGSISPRDALKELGGSVHDLAADIDNVGRDDLNRRIDDLGNGLKGLGDIKGVKQAHSDIAALDGALADLASSDPGAAATAVVKLGKSLEAEGFSTKDLVALLPKYDDALKRATRGNRDGADAKRDDAAAAKELASNVAALSTTLADQAQHTFDLRTTEANAAKAVSDAEGGLAAARKQSVDDHLQALKDEADAEQGVRDAQRDSTKAQEDLSQARDDARKHISDLTDATVKAVQSERDAVLALHEAEAENRKVLADPRSSALDKEKASVGLADAKDNESQASKGVTQAQAEENAAKRAGIEGDKGVVDAKQKVADAQDRVREATDKVREASRQARETQVADAKAITEAQDKVNQARLDEAKAWSDLATATFGAKAGLEQYRIKLGELAGDLDPSNPLQSRIKALYDSITQIVTQWPANTPRTTATGQGELPNRPQGAPHPPGTAGRVGTAQDGTADRSVRTAPVSITIHNHGTDVQTRRKNDQAVTRSVDRFARATR